MLGFLRKLLNPTGPIGEWLSPSVVFKPRQGLPISAPKAMYAQAPTTTADLSFVQGERTLPPEADVPASRVRSVSAFVDEVFSPIYASTQSTDIWDILRAGQTLVGWKVTLRPRDEARARPVMSSEQFVEHMQSLQIQATDEFYNQYLDFVKGNDPVIVDGQVLRGEATYDENGKMTHDGIIRGGTQIRHGRKEYAEKTKDYIHIDEGYWKERQAYLDERASRPVRNVKQALDAFKGEVLPTWRPVGMNPIKDRMRAV